MSSFNNSNPSSTSSSTKSYKVAYALNPKKLRKSNKSSTSSSNPSDASSTSIEGDPIWQGGGLADVLHFSSFSLHYPIQFIHWEENIQDCKLIIHKLTEEIERSGEGERLSGINLSNLLNNDHNLSESESESESDFPQLSSVSYDSVTSDTSIINDQNDEKKLEAIEKITSISNYIMSMGGRVRLIDSFESVARVTNRLRSTLCIRIIEDIYRRKFSNRLEKSSFYPINSYLSSSNYLPIIQPNFLFINNKIKPKHILKLMKKYSLNFPIICKPTLACSTPTSHLLSIILSYEDLSTIPRPCILQQYLNHSEKFYKIYNIGNNILISKRKSLPDLNLIYLLNDNQSNLNDQINYYENLLNSSLTSLTIHSSVSNLNDLLKNKENSLNTNYLPYLITKSYEINEKNNEKILKYKLLQAKSVTFDSRYTYPSLKNFIVNLSEYSEEEIKEERKNTDNDIVMNDNVKGNSYFFLFINLFILNFFFFSFM